MKNKDLLIEMNREILSAHYILLVTPSISNIDLLSSSLSLSNYFFENKIKHKVFNSNKVLPRKINFLSKFDKIVEKIPRFYDLVIYLENDISNYAELEIDDSIKKIYLDVSDFDNINSRFELLYSFYKYNNIQITRKNAECLYVGIYDSSFSFTSSFINKNIFNIIAELMDTKIDICAISNNLKNRESLSKFKIIPKIMNTLDLFHEGTIATVQLENKWIEETGVFIEECDDVIDTVLTIGIVKVAVYFIIINEETIKASFSSKGDVDVALIAKELGGKGSKTSSSCIFNNTNFFTIKKKVIRTILSYI